MIRVEGMIARPCRLTFDDLAALEGQVSDVSKIIAGRDGVAVTLAAIVQHAAVDPEATHLTVIAEDDSFSASVPLAAVEALAARRRAVDLTDCDRPRLALGKGYFDSAR